MEIQTDPWLQYLLLQFYKQQQWEITMCDTKTNLHNFILIISDGLF